MRRNRLNLVRGIAAADFQLKSNSTILRFKILKILRLLGRHKVGREAPAAAARDERNAMGSSNDGAKPREELPVEQAVRERHLPGSVRVHRSLERVRLHVSIILYRAYRAIFETIE